MKYYALTEKGLNKVEAGLTGRSQVEEVLGALMDLEEQYEGTHPITALEVSNLVRLSDAEVVQTLNRAVSRGYVEVVAPGDERFTWTGIL